MRIVTFSDTHQNTSLFKRCVERAIADGRIDVFIHCGDGVRDLLAVEGLLLKSNPNIKIYAVRGNCDLSAFQYPVSEMIDVPGARIWITHGNGYGVKHGLGKLSKAGRELKADIVFFGHTHARTVAHKHGVTLINPGSLSAAFHTGTAYLQTIIDPDHEIQTSFVKF